MPLLQRATHVSGRLALSLILGGGKGIRLYPLTKDRSKPAVPFGGNYRLIDIPISNCINSGINRIFVMTQYNSASLNRHITQTYKFDIFHNGFVDILASEQTMDNVQAGFSQGTADAVRRALKHLNPFRDAKNAPYILILAGDQLYRMDFRKFLEHHIEHKADISIGIIPVCTEDINRFGILKVNEKCKIIDFIEKPGNVELIKNWKIPDCFKNLKNDKKIYFASMGIYVFNIDVLYDLLLTHPEMLDFGKEIIPYAIKSGYNCYGFIHEGYWEDIGTIKSFHSANIELTKENPEFDLYSLTMPFFSHPRFLPPSRIIKSDIQSCLISDGVFIEEAKLKHSVLGVRSIVKKGVEIENSVIMGADFYDHSDDTSSQIPVGIGENTVIRNAIIDKNCRIGKNVRIVNEAKILNKEETNYSIVDGIVVVTKNSIIPDGTVI
ncbi:MAG: glucose-1-phosphate adenylyltransferase [Brevinematia bacterium]